MLVTGGRALTRYGPRHQNPPAGTRQTQRRVHHSLMTFNKWPSPAVLINGTARRLNVRAPRLVRRVSVTLHWNPPERHAEAPAQNPSEGKAKVCVTESGEDLHILNRLCVSFHATFRSSSLVTLQFLFFFFFFCQCVPNLRHPHHHPISLPHTSHLN